MRITTRIALGLALLAGLMIGMMGYQLASLQKMHHITRDLSESNLSAARISLRLRQSVDSAHELASKWVMLGDSSYLELWDEWQESVEFELEQLTDLELSDAEGEAKDRIRQRWTRYLDTVAALRGEIPVPPADTTISSPPGAELAVVPDSSAVEVLARADDILAELRREIDELIALNDLSVAERAESSALAAEDARRASLITTGITVGLALLIAFFFYRSIAGPVRRLLPGTREMAQGHLAHRLEVKGHTELSELAQDFNELAGRLSELEQLKQDFVAHISHELKGPLAAIHETILILLEEIPGPLTSKQAHLLELSQQSAGRLSAMIGNVLEVSRLEAGTHAYDPRRNDLADITETVLRDIEPVIEERDLELSLAIGAGGTEALCDGDRIRGAVHNLVRNAVMFSPEGGRIEIELARVEDPPETVPARWSEEGDPEDGPFLLFALADQGPGIPDEHKVTIFDKFSQLNRGKRSQGQGAGLGLYICRRVVEAHAGAVWVEDAEEEGSIFKMLIPVTPRRWANRPLSDDLGLGTAQPASTRIAGRRTTGASSSHSTS